MQTVKLDMYQALAVAVVMLLIGRELVARIEFLRRYCIPAPVVGGLVFAIVHAVLRGTGIMEFDMDVTLQKVFMTAFFCSVGYMAAFGMLKKGGIGVILFLGISAAMCVIQDLVGASAQRPSALTRASVSRWVRSRWSAATEPQVPGAPSSRISALRTQPRSQSQPQPTA